MTFRITATLMGILWLFPVGVADAHRVIAGEGASPPLRAYNDRLVWSRLEGTGYVLMTYSGNAVTRLPLPVRALPFDVDLGPDETGATVAVYARCDRDDTVSTLTLGPCALHKFDIGTGQDQLLRVHVGPRCHLSHPAIWKSTIAYVRRCKGEPAIIHVRDEKGNRNVTVRPPRRAVDLPRRIRYRYVAVNRIDLQERSLVYLTYHFGHQIRLVNLNHASPGKIVAESPRRHFSRIRLDSPQFANGYLYYQQFTAGGIGTYYERYRLSSGRRQRARPTSLLSDFAFSDGNLFYITGDRLLLGGVSFSG